MACPRAAHKGQRAQEPPRPTTFWLGHVPRIWSSERVPPSDLKNVERGASRLWNPIEAITGKLPLGGSLRAYPAGERAYVK